MEQVKHMYKVFNGIESSRIIEIQRWLMDNLDLSDIDRKLEITVNVYDVKTSKNNKGKTP